MARLQLFAWLPLSTVVLAACGDNTTPTQPETSGDREPSAALAAASNTWTARAPLPRYRTAFAIGMAPNAAGQSIVYAFGGRDEEDFPVLSILGYNVATDSWTGRAGAFRPANTNGVGKIGNRFYLTGGRTEGDFFRVFNTTFAYEPSTDRVFQKADMPKATFSGVTGVIDRKLYVLPGYCTGELDFPGHCATAGPIRQLYRYDPATNAWVTRRQAPHFHMNGGSGVIDGKFYVVGGQILTGSLVDLDVYNPATNTWRTLAPLPAPGEEVWGAVLQGKLFVVVRSRGNNGEVKINAYAYNPKTNTWATRAAPPVGGPIVRVTLGGQSRLLLVGSTSTHLYTP